MANRKLTLKDFFDISPISQISVAKEAKISPILFRQYVCGIKDISEKRLKLVEKTINKMGQKLAKTKLA